MKIIGIVGGIASGKSLVAGQLQRLGAVRLDADRAGHEALREPEVEIACRQRWGDAIFAPDGRVDRRALARIVFAPAPDGPRELAALEQLTHPRIAAKLMAEIERCRRAGAPAAVLDAAVMLKAGWDRMCDIIVFVDTPRELRMQRARERGWSDEDFAAREAAQETLNVKRRRADVSIDNSGFTEDTQAQVVRLWRALTA